MCWKKVRKNTDIFLLIGHVFANYFCVELVNKLLLQGIYVRWVIGLEYLNANSHRERLAQNWKQN